MALQTINIDDRTYDQFFEELKKHIPVTDWTDHNLSDPGIMLLELFAWLGDMSLYRMNRVPNCHREKFLKLIIDPPEAVTVEVKLELKVLLDREEFSIPAGIRFATGFRNGKRYIFETFEETKLRNLQTGVHKITVMTRSWKEITDEELGESKGTPIQALPFKKASMEKPVLLDFVHASTKYKPNPEILVGGKEWLLKPFLLTKDSKVSLPSNPAEHFMVDDFDNLVRFGDGVFGAIPPKGEKIVCKRYQILEGPEALIKAGTIKHILDEIPGLQSGESLSIEQNEDAKGGMYFLRKHEQFTKGLENFRSTYRLITAEDFETILLTDFNELQRLTRENEFNELEGQQTESTLKILRAVPMMDKEPSTSGLQERPGHVTILVIPEFTPNNTPPYITQDKIDIGESLKSKILRFLEKRKLIATRLHLIPAKLKEIEKIKIGVVISREQNSLEMESKIRKEICDFINILEGFFGKKGWPLGKNLYKSHIYRVVEDIEGVDHVSSLILEPSNDQGDVETAEYELPVLQRPETIEININRK